MLLALPVCAAFLYAAGQLELKRAMNAGADRRRVTGDSNAALILWSLPLAFFLPGQWHPAGFTAAVVAGAFLFTGRIFMVRALELGDLSLVAPVLATKTILVGVNSLATGSGVVDGRLVGAAALASLGVALLGHGPSTGARARWKALGLAGLASVLFALSDVATQGYAKLLGPGWFLPVMFGTVFLLFPFLGRQPRAPDAARRPLLRGSAIMGFQTSLVIFVISLTGQATLVNILYSTRSLWSVVVDSVADGGQSREYLAWRLAGALALTCAVVLALWR